MKNIKNNNNEPCAIFTVSDKDGNVEYEIMLVNHDSKNEEENIAKFMNICSLMTNSGFRF